MRRVRHFKNGVFQNDVLKYDSTTIFLNGALKLTFPYLSLVVPSYAFSEMIRANSAKCEKRDLNIDGRVSLICGNTTLPNATTRDAKCPSEIRIYIFMLMYVFVVDRIK